MKFLSPSRHVTGVWSFMHLRSCSRIARQTGPSEHVLKLNTAEMRTVKPPKQKPYSWKAEAECQAFATIRGTCLALKTG